MFWPREVWGRYAERLDAFKEPAHARAAVRCLNALVANALAHAPRCLEYMANLRNPAVFRFCAIPQARLLADRCQHGASGQGAPLRNQVTNICGCLLVKL